MSSRTLVLLRHAKAETPGELPRFQRRVGVVELAFPHDLIVNVHCTDQPLYSGKITAAYADCGSKGTVQTVSDLITAGGFPPFLLQPINFEALYAEGLRQRAAQQDLAGTETAGNA